MKKIFLILTTIFFIGCEEDPIMYTLTVSSNPTEGGTINPSSGDYEDGTEVTINVKPNNNFSFKDWSGSWSGTESPLTIIMDGNKTLIGNFNFLDSDGDGVGDDDDLDNNTRPGVPVDENGVMLNPIYLDENGITIKSREWGTFGDTGEVNGVEYTIGHRSYVETWINEGKSLNQLCTTLFTEMTNLFQSPNHEYNGDISNWDVSNVTEMYGMFSGSQFNGDISNWDVSSVTNMGLMFNQSQFNGDISNWDVSNVTNMYSMFSRSQFNGNINSWDVSNVVNMSTMFEQYMFNQDLSNWDVSSVENMGYMFRQSQFNGDISNWDVSNVELMWDMFSESLFNQDISTWDVSNVVNMNMMFYESNFINQDLSTWDVSNVISCSGFSNNTPQWTLPKPNFTNCTP